MSALIGDALDKQLSKSNLTFSGTLPQAITVFGDLTGVRIEADDDVYGALPWGDLTTFHAKFTHQTLRQALTAVCGTLGLEFELGPQAVLLHPIPALRRIGRRCTTEELAAVNYLSHTPLSPTSAQMHLSPTDLVASIDEKLEKSPYAIENRAFDPPDKSVMTIARNATLLDALEEIATQTRATWYPWGRSIVILRKPEQIRMQLSKRLTTRFNGEDVTQVLQELAHRAGVLFQIESGAIQKIPAADRTVRLVLDDASVQQTLESIAGFTGLAYEITDEGVRITFTGSPTTATSNPAN